MKRLVDIIVALVMLTVLSPVMAVVALCIWRSMGSPVLFRQSRAGRHGHPFTLFKFRTMSDARDAEGQLLPDHERMTPVGAFIRSTSMDELPQLFNVLRGEMSLVGPRPLLLEYNDRYSPRQATRLAVKPGITGWAQINGRNALCWEERFELDAWYVEHQTFLLDVKILFATLGKVFRRDGISQQGHVTMEPFQGSVNLPEASLHK